jgi:RimJ/RimL family protein N-acetyltransferase
MIFQTENLALRPFEADDVGALQTYLNHPQLSGRRYLPDGFSDDIPLSRKQVEALLDKWGQAKDEAHLAIILTERQELVGHAEMEWEWDPHAPWISVVISPTSQRRGYGTEVIGLLLKHLFENTVAHNISSWMADWNQAAREFAKSLGFQESGRFRREGFHQGQYYDGILVDILRPEWAAAQER